MRYCVPMRSTSPSIVRSFSRTRTLPVVGSSGGVARLGPAAALTGPVARGDWDTVARHVAVLDPSERPAYEALMHAAARLVGRDGEVPALCN